MAPNPRHRGPLLLKAAAAIALPLTTYGIYSRYQRSQNRLSSESLQTNPLLAPVDPATKSTKVDVLVVGSGGSALVAALRARHLGLSTLVVEASPKLGGTSCFSGSGCWIPNTHVQNLPPSEDNFEKALTYLENIIPTNDEDSRLASSDERRTAFLTRGPEMVKWLGSGEVGYKWKATPAYPDYFPYAPGARVGGRSIEAGAWDRGLLGDEDGWGGLLNINPVRPALPLYTHELSKVVRAKCSVEGLWTAGKIFGLRPAWWDWVEGGKVCTLGVSMISQLVYLNVKAGTPIWTSSPMTELKVDASTGRVTGAVVERKVKGEEGGAEKVEKITVEVSRGVIIAAGGFARNDAMRKQFQPQGITADWTSTCDTDTGSAISAAMKIGTATALMDSSWWGAAMWDPVTRRGIWSVYDRGLPHSIIVDKTGRRWTNESQNYNSMGTAIWNRQATGKDTIPSFLVLDSTHRSRYLFASRFMPGAEIPQECIDSGFVFKANTLPELAKQLGVDEKGLVEEVTKFNGFVDKGKDEDFGRGDSVYDSYLGDPAYSKNRNLGKIAKGPFYAVKIWPGDLGTKGGVLTDDKARALRAKKGGGYEVIPGLYAAGNSSASVMGRTYAGAGATLGPGLTFAYIAATDCARPESSTEQ